MKFNEKLLKLRREKGLSQEELGMEMQVSRQTVSKWEAGQSYPDFTRLVMLRNCREIICIFLESMLIYVMNEFSDSGGHFHGT